MCAEKQLLTCGETNYCSIYSCKHLMAFVVPGKQLLDDVKRHIHGGRIGKLVNRSCMGQHRRSLNIYCDMMSVEENALHLCVDGVDIRVLKS